MQERAALPTFPKRKVGRRKGGRGRQRRHIEWISSHSKPSPKIILPGPVKTSFIARKKVTRRNDEACTMAGLVNNNPGLGLLHVQRYA